MFEESNVTLIKQNGEIIQDIMARVQPDIIFIKDLDLPIEEYDIIERKLGNGLTEKFIVMDRGIYSTGYQCKVKRENVVNKSKEQSIAIYNVSGQNSKVNINSTDNSISVITSNSNEIFEKLIDAVKSNGNNNQEIISCILDMRENVANKPKYLEKFQELTTIGASIMSIIGPFLPALIQLI